MAFLAICGGCCALLMNGSASAECEQADALIKFLKYVRNQVDCYALPAREILEGCDVELLESCGFYNCPRDLSFEMISRDCEIYDEECARIMRDFLSGFGKSYKDEQIRECDRCLSALLERREKLFAELPKKKKINSTVCIASALCLGLLLA